MVAKNSASETDAGVTWRMPAVHPEGRKFALIGAGVTLVLAWLAWETIAWPMAGLTIGILAFFRDPERSVPQDDSAIIAPADGMVTMIRSVLPPAEISGGHGLGDAPLTRISIFMSVFDVHINRTPIEGVVKQIVYISGKFLNADLDKASDDNERQHVLIERRDGLRVGFTQIAGLVARRIVPFVKTGDMIVAGQRIGLIRFGSRVDIYLPKGAAAKVALGQRTVAGETILARLGDSEAVRGVVQ